jgi:hypothetical protein
MEQISRMILDYLSKNLEAGDTLEGITKWWMNDQKIEFSTKEVVETLKNLVRKGLIRAHDSKCGTTFYKIRRDA